MKKYCKIILLSIIIAIAISNIFSIKPVKASEGYGLIITKKGNYYSPTLARVRYNFSDPYIFRTAYPQ